MPFVNRVKVYVDGCVPGVRGPAGAAAIVFDADGNELARTARYLGECTNNEAEYEAVLLGMDLAASVCTHSIEIHSDSELVTRQLNRNYKVKAANLLERHKKVRVAEAIFKSVDYIATSRSNHRIKLADRLARDCLNKALM